MEGSEAGWVNERMNGRNERRDEERREKHRERKLTIGPVEVARLAKRFLSLRRDVADVVAGLEAADESCVGVDLVRLLPASGTRGSQ